VFKAVLDAVRKAEPGRVVEILYELRCARTMPVALVHKVCDELNTLTGGNPEFMKACVSQWVGSLQTFRQPRTSMESMLTESLSDCLAIAGGEDGIQHTVVHTVSVGGKVAVLYDTRQI